MPTTFNTDGKNLKATMLIEHVDVEIGVRNLQLKELKGTVEILERFKESPRRI